MSLILGLIMQQAGARPYSPALRGGGHTIAFGELSLAIAAMANRIDRADPRQSPVAIALPNGIEAVLADLALLRLGRVAVMLPPGIVGAGRDAALRAAGASAIIEPGGIRSLERAAITHPAETAKISYTAGSTGAPGPVCLSERQLQATACAVIQRLGLSGGGLHLALLPLGTLLENVAGLYASLIAGRTYLAESDGSTERLSGDAPERAVMAAIIGARAATSLILSLPLLSGLVAQLERGGDRLPSVTQLIVSGERVPPRLLAAAAAVGLPVTQGYGLVECGSLVTLENPGEQVRGTAGTPLTHLHVTLADDGEIVVHDRLALPSRGAARGAEAGAAAFPTGDIGAFDESGRLLILGRAANRIVTAFGRAIAPEWIEAELAGQREIAQALVHGDNARALSALIVPTADGLDPFAAIAAVNARLPAYARIAAWSLAPPFVASDGTATLNGSLRRAAILARQAALPSVIRLGFSAPPP